MAGAMDTRAGETTVAGAGSRNGAGATAADVSTTAATAAMTPGATMTPDAPVSPGAGMPPGAPGSATDPARHPITGRPKDQPLADLMKQLSEQTTRLVHQEIELAKAELTVKGKRVGIGAGMFGGAGVLGFYAVGALTATAILALSLAVTAWLAALIVAVVLGAVAGIMALQGKTKVQQGTPPMPEQATESVKEDVHYAKIKAQEARR